MIVLLLSFLFLIAGFFVNQKLIENSAVLKQKKTTLAEKLSYKKRFLDKDEWLKVAPQNKKALRLKGKKLSLTLPFVSADRLKASYKSLELEIQLAKNWVYNSVLAVLTLMLVYVLLMLCMRFLLQAPLVFLITTVTLSILCLHIGLCTPMLEIGAVERNFDLAEIPIQKSILGFELKLQIQKKFEGDVYFYYQNKSIFNLIQLLFKQQNYIVGSCILLFSVLFPLIKTLLMCGFIANPSIKNKDWFKNFVLNLSKWSMADVFVVAVFLGFLAFENMQAGILTYSNVCIGLYFFLSYCILSIIGSIAAKNTPEIN
jgi:hypothetical protein